MLPSRTALDIVNIHASCVAAGNGGVLILGQSGQGKSDLALRLIDRGARSEEHTSELQSLMRNSYAVFCLKKNIANTQIYHCFVTVQYSSDINTIQTNSSVT